MPCWLKVLEQEVFAHPYRAGAEKARRARISRVSSIVLVSRENNVIDPSMGVQRIDPNTNQTLSHERETRRGGRNRNANISLPSANIYIHESIPENFSNIHLFLSPFLPFLSSTLAPLFSPLLTRLDSTKRLFVSLENPPRQRLVSSLGEPLSNRGKRFNDTISPIYPKMGGEWDGGEE